MKRIILIFALFAMGCSTAPKDGDRAALLLSELSFMNQPDSLLTPEQLEIKDVALSTFFTKVVVEADTMRLTVDKGYFTQNNIPIAIYDMICSSLRENAIAFARWRQEGLDFDVAKTFEESKAEFMNKKR